MITQTVSSPVTKQRIYLSVIFALFAVPLALAWLMIGRWQPEHTTNHGELLNPAQPVAHLAAQQPDGQSITQDFLNGHWTMLYIDDAKCDARCETGLYDIRQVRLALGKNMPRAQTLFLMQEQPSNDMQQWLSQEHIDMTVGVADTQTLDFFTQAFSVDGNVSTLGGWIYLIDPLGNLFMRYSTDSNPKDILDDLRHLLKISKIG